MRAPRLASLVALLAALAPAAARASDPADPLRPGLRSWYALPVAFYTPETRLGLGAIGGLHLGLARGLPSSSVDVAAYWTTTRQASLDVQSQLFGTPRLALGTELRLSEQPDFFYGLGPDAPARDEEAFTTRIAKLVLGPELRLGDTPVRAGPKLHLQREVVVDAEPGGALAGGALTGSRAFTAIGVGAGLTFDDRDHLFQPTRGRLVTAFALAYPGVRGTDAFARASLDARQLVPLGRGHVLGLALSMEGALGDVPFTLLPKLGGARDLRGFREGRYRGPLAWSAQAEHRFPVAGRFRGAVFAGLGGVARAGRASAPQPAGGAGLRFRMTHDGAVIRGDVAAGDGVQLYLVTLEAF